MSEVFRRPGDVAFGRDGRPFFFIRAGGGREPVHVAFAAPDRATVDRFHAAATAAGGADNGRRGRAITTRATTARSCWIRTGTTWRRSATCERQGPVVSPSRGQQE